MFLQPAELIADAFHKRITRRGLRAARPQRVSCHFADGCGCRGSRETRVKVADRVQILCCTKDGLPGKKMVTGCMVSPISVKVRVCALSGITPLKLNEDWNPEVPRALGMAIVALQINGTVTVDRGPLPDCRVYVPVQVNGRAEPRPKPSGMGVMIGCVKRSGAFIILVARPCWIVAPPLPSKTSSPFEAPL